MSRDSPAGTEEMLLPSNTHLDEIEVSIQIFNIYNDLTRGSLLCFLTKIKTGCLVESPELFRKNCIVCGKYLYAAAMSSKASD